MSKSVATVGYNKSVGLSDVFSITAKGQYVGILDGCTFANRTDSCNVGIDTAGVIFIDYDNDGLNDNGNEYMGYITVECIEENEAQLSATAFGSYTVTNAKATGAIVYTVKDAAGNTVKTATVYYDGSK